MNKLGGTWNGEYSINHGTEEEPEISYFNFKIKIKEEDGSFTGTFTDQTIVSDESQIQGFIEDNFISFIRPVEQSSEFREFLNFELEDENKPLEFNFSGNWNSEEESFVGVWDLEIDVEREGLQEDVLVESRTGGWYLSRL